jgi:hypothetical protein
MTIEDITDLVPLSIMKIFYMKFAVGATQTPEN